MGRIVIVLCCVLAIFAIACEASNAQCPKAKDCTVAPACDADGCAVRRTPIRTIVKARPVRTVARAVVRARPVRRTVGAVVRRVRCRRCR
jgi:hypothetical protein